MLGDSREVGREVGGREALVDVVLLEGIFGQERKARPDYGVWIEGRNKEGQGGCGDVVGEMTVGESAAAQVEE